jgi:2'-5' RNA ligase
MRLFIGISIPPELTQKIRKIQESIAKRGIDIKLVEPENLHFCLKFLGDTPEENIPIIKKALNDVESKFEHFNVKLYGIGAFPNTNYARVLWIGTTEGKEILKAISEELELYLSKEGFKEGEKEFSPHLTLGRIRSGRNKDALLALFKELDKVDIGTFIANKISLISSELTPEGPKYKEIYKIALK